MLPRPDADARYRKTSAPVLGSMVFAVAVIIFNVLAACWQTEEARTAEREAMAESERRRLEAESRGGSQVGLRGHDLPRTAYADQRHPGGRQRARTHRRLQRRPAARRS
jgi:hypothetical protein